MAWQRLGGVPGRYTWALLKTAKKVIKGLMAGVKEKSEEFQEQKQCLRISSPECGNQRLRNAAESGIDSDSSGVLIEEDESSRHPKGSELPIIDKSTWEPEIATSESGSLDKSP